MLGRLGQPPYRLRIWWVSVKAMSPHNLTSDELNLTCFLQTAVELV